MGRVFKRSLRVMKLVDLCNKSIKIPQIPNNHPSILITFHGVCLQSSISMFLNCLGPAHNILDHELFQKVTEFYNEWKSLLHQIWNISFTSFGIFFVIGWIRHIFKYGTIPGVNPGHEKFISMPESVEIGLKLFFHGD